MNLSIAFGSKFHLHKETILTALLHNWQGAPVRLGRSHCSELIEAGMSPPLSRREPKCSCFFLA